MFKNKIKKIMKKTFVYKWYSLFLKDRVEEKRVLCAKQELQTNGKKIIKMFSRKLEKEKILFFVNFGSLLGLIRDQKFMSYDCDMDFGIIFDENFTWNNLECVLHECGARKTKQFTYNGEITEQSYRIGHLDIDFFRYYIDEENAYEYFYYRNQNEEYENDCDYNAARFNVYKISGVKKIKIGEDEFFIPNEPEEYLASIYSENWRVPDPNWNHVNGPSFESLSGEYGLAEYF